MKKYLLQKSAWRVAVLMLVVLMSVSCVNSSLAIGQCGSRLAYGDTVYESVPARGYACSYTFIGKAKDVVDIKMIKRAASLNPYLELYDPYGKKVVSNDNISAVNNNSEIKYQLYSNGTYKIVAQGGATRTSSGAFMLSLTLTNTKGTPIAP